MTTTRAATALLRPRTRGRLVRRLLVNATADPKEVERELPAGLRVHVTQHGAVVGNCLLELESVRPSGLPAASGVRIRAAASRISVEWDTPTGVEVGVYVPERRTSSRPAQLVGGRLFPGVHKQAVVDIDTDDDQRSWCYSGTGFDVRVTAQSRPCPVDPSEPVGRACLPAEVGISPRRDGSLEAVRMELADGYSEQLQLDEVSSTFINGFASAVPATAYLMQDRSVLWTATPAPAPGVLSHTWR